MYRLIVTYRLDLPDDITEGKFDPEEVERMYKDKEIVLDGAERDVWCLYYGEKKENESKS